MECPVFPILIGLFSYFSGTNADHKMYLNHQAKRQKNLWSDPRSLKHQLGQKKSRQSKMVYFEGKIRKGIFSPRKTKFWLECPVFPVLNGPFSYFSGTNADHKMHLNHQEKRQKNLWSDPRSLKHQLGQKKSRQSKMVYFEGKFRKGFFHPQNQNFGWSVLSLRF